MDFRKTEEPLTVPHLTGHHRADETMLLIVTLIASGEKKNCEILNKDHIYHSLSTAEGTAIQSLTSNHQIVVKPADKRGTILNYDDYVKGAN